MNDYSSIVITNAVHNTFFFIIFHLLYLYLLFRQHKHTTEGSISLRSFSKPFSLFKAYYILICLIKKAYRFTIRKDRLFVFIYLLHEYQYPLFRYTYHHYHQGYGILRLYIQGICKPDYHRLCKQVHRLHSLIHPD